MAVTIFFGQILNMSLTASIIILLVMAVRLLLKRSPKIYSYALWAVVLFRLLCPISIASELSVLELTQPKVSQAANVSYVSYAPVEEVLIAGGDMAPPAQETPIPIQELEPQAEKTPSVMEVISWCYLAGAAVMILSSLVSYLRLYRDLVGAVRWKSNIYLADHIASPFVLGTLFPRIYLPSNTPMAERRYIVAHERHHIRRCDHVIKLLAYAALCLHWFNPLVWVAFVLAGKDMEMSCDEAVIKKLGEHIRADYSASLLRFATHRTIIAGTPLAFGEGDTKGRVMNMAKWRKPKVWVSILCGALCILILAVCALNPKEEQSLAEMTRTTSEGPTGCAYGELHYTLPGGVTHELRDIPKSEYRKEYWKVVFGKKARNLANVFWSVDGVEIGGIVDYLLPEGKSMANSDWLHEIDLPEWEEENLGRFGSSSNYGVWELEFFTDVPPGTEVEPVQRRHIFFVDYEDERILDMWFDLLTAPPDVMEAILKSASIGEEIIKADGLILSSTGEVLGSNPEIQLSVSGSRLQFADLTMELPAGYTTQHSAYGHVDLLSEGKNVGYIQLRGLPDLKLDMKETNNSEEWVKALGLPEAQDSENPIAFMIDGTINGSYLHAWYGNERDHKKMNVNHELFITDTMVYDIFYDLNQITEPQATEFLQTIYISGQPTVLTDPEAISEEQSALAKCRTVLQQIQGNSAYKITTQRTNGPEALNPTSTFTEWGYGDNRLAFNRIPESGGESMFGGLYWDALSYECDSQQTWSKVDHWTWQDPWLSSYQWSEENVTYLETVEDEGETTIRLRIEEPYGGDVKNGTQYFVSFRFDARGAFQFVTVQAFLENMSILETESVVTLNPDTVWSEMAEEVRRATGIAVKREQYHTDPLLRCREIVEAVQCGSYSIFYGRDYKSDVPVDFVTTYAWHKGSWFADTSVVIGSSSEHHANLFAGGKYFSNRGNWDKTEIVWAPLEHVAANAQKPWLATFLWDDSKVSLQGTNTENDITTVTLRIDDLPYGSDSHEDHYWVNFYFYSTGALSHVDLTVDKGLADEFSQWEDIGTLDPKNVDQIIQQEYLRATGKTEEETKPLDGELYQTWFESSDGTVTVTIYTHPNQSDLEQHGLKYETLQSIIEKKLRSKSVDGFGLDTAAMGYEGAHCHVRITDIKPGSDYLVAANTAVPTIEVWGTRTYTFGNGEQMGDDQDPIQLLLLNAKDGTILLSFGEKN